MRAFASMTRRDSRSVQNASTPFESRGLRPRHEGPGPTPRTPDDATRGLIQGRDSEEIDNPCLVEVLPIRPLPRPLPRPPAEVRMGAREGAVSAHAGRKRISIKTIRSPSQINYLPAESWIRSFVELSCLACTATVCANCLRYCMAAHLSGRLNSVVDIIQS